MPGVLEVRTRDAEAFAALYRRHYGAVLGYAVRRLADRETAREIAVDVFRIAWERFDPASPPDLAWLLGVARNRLGDAYRRRDRERRLVDAQRPERDAADDERVRDVLDALPEPVREVLVLTYWDGLAAADVGALLGCSTGAVWMRLHRARRAFAAIWEEQG